jgi:hypothetical protein
MEIRILVASGYTLSGGLLEVGTFGFGFFGQPTDGSLRIFHFRIPEGRMSCGSVMTLIVIHEWNKLICKLIHNLLCNISLTYFLMLDGEVLRQYKLLPMTRNE